MKEKIKTKRVKDTAVRFLEKDRMKERGVFISCDGHGGCHLGKPPRCFNSKITKSKRGEERRGGPKFTDKCSLLSAFFFFFSYYYCFSFNLLYLQKE